MNALPIAQVNFMTGTSEYSTEPFDFVTAHIWWQHELAKWILGWNAEPNVDTALLFSWSLWPPFLGWFPQHLCLQYIFWLPPASQEVMPGNHLLMHRRLGQTAAINSSLYISWFPLCLIRHMVMWPSGIPTLPIELVALAKVKCNILCVNSWHAHVKPFAQQNMSSGMIVTLTLILLTWRIGWAHNNARK